MLSKILIRILVIFMSAYIIYIVVGVMYQTPSEKSSPPVKTPEAIKPPVKTPEAIKHGLTIAVRKEIFNKIEDSENRSRIAAEKMYPTSIKGAGDVEKAKANIYKNIDYMRELDKKYRADICKRYSITEEQRNSIMVEGVVNKW